ncbi:MAG: hypothetical protein AB1489_06365 [Acidobacteriota bacterium]
MGHRKIFALTLFLVATIAGSVLLGSAYSTAPTLTMNIAAFPEKELAAGMMQSYSLKVTNSGTLRATNIQVRATVDRNLQVLHVTDGTFNSQSSTAHWSIGDLAAGHSVTVSFMGRLNTTASIGEELAVQMFVRSNEQSELMGGKIKTRVSPSPKDARAQLITFQTVDPQQARPGETVVFHIIVHNDGQAAAEEIVVNERLPRELELLSEHIHPHLSNFANSSAPYLSYDPDAGTLQVKLERLLPGEWMALMFNARIRDSVRTGYQINAEALMEASNPQLRISAPAHIDVGANLANATLEVKVDKTNAMAGDKLTYTITVCNKDNKDITKLKIDNKIPKALRLVRGSATTSCGLQVVEAGDKGQVLWKKGTLPAASGGSDGCCSVSFQATVVDGLANGTVITDTASAKAKGVKKLSATAQTTVQAANTASVDMMDNFFAPKDLTVSPGTVVTWTNRGAHPHTVTPSPCSIVAVSSDGQFPSGLTRDQKFSFTVPANTNSGTIIYYYCRFHGAAGNCTAAGPGMAGTIKVN